MKKLLLGLGTVVSATTPIVAVVACGDDKATAPTGPITEFDANGIRTQASINAKIDSITVPTVETDKSAADLRALVNGWGLGAGDVATAMAKTNNYEKAGSKLDGQFVGAAFYNSQWAESEENHKKFFQNVAAFNVLLNGFKTWNDANPANLVKLGAHLSGPTINEKRDHQVNKAELLRILNKYKTLVASSNSAGLKEIINESITIANGLTDFAAPVPAQEFANGIRTQAWINEHIDTINAPTVETDKSAADLRALVNGWGFAAGDIATAMAKANNYEKAGSKLDGQFAAALFYNSEWAAHPNKFFETVAAINVLLNGFKTWNDDGANSANLVKLGAPLAGATLREKTDHQVNKAELLRMLDRFKFLVSGSNSAGLKEIIDESITIAKTLTDFS